MTQVLGNTCVLTMGVNYVDVLILANLQFFCLAHWLIPRIVWNCSSKLMMMQLINDNYNIWRKWLISGHKSMRSIPPGSVWKGCIYMGNIKQFFHFSRELLFFILHWVSILAQANCHCYDSRVLISLYGTIFSIYAPLSTFTCGLKCFTAFIHRL